MMEVDQSPSVTSSTSSDLEDEEKDDLPEVINAVVDPISEKSRINNLGDIDKHDGVDEGLIAHNKVKETNEEFTDIQNETSPHLDNKVSDIPSLTEDLQDSSSIENANSPNTRENHLEEEFHKLEELCKDKEDPPLPTLVTTNCSEKGIQHQQHPESSSSVKEVQMECIENHPCSNVDIRPSVNINDTSNVNLPTQTFPITCDDNSSSSYLELNKPPDNYRADFKAQLRIGSSTEVNIEHRTELESDNSEGLARINENSESSYDNFDDGRGDDKPTNEYEVTTDICGDSKTPSQSKTVEETLKNQLDVSDESKDEEEFPSNHSISNKPDTNPNTCHNDQRKSSEENSFQTPQTYLDEHSNKSLSEERPTSSGDIEMSAEEKDQKISPDCTENSNNGISEHSPSERCVESPGTSDKSLENSEESFDERTVNEESDELLNQNSTETIQSEINKCDKLVDYDKSDDDFDSDSTDSQQSDGDSPKNCNNKGTSRSDKDEEKYATEQSKSSKEIGETKTSEQSNVDHDTHNDCDFLNESNSEILGHSKNTSQILTDENWSSRSESLYSQKTNENFKKPSIEQPCMGSLNTEPLSRETKAICNKQNNGLGTEGSTSTSSEDSTITNNEKSSLENSNSQFVDNKIDENPSDLESHLKDDNMRLEDDSSEVNEISNSQQSEKIQENSSDSDHNSTTSKDSKFERSNSNDPSNDKRGNVESSSMINDSDDQSNITKVSSKDMSAVQTIEALLLKQKVSNSSENDLLKHIQETVKNKSQSLPKETGVLNQIQNLIEDSENLFHKNKSDPSEFRDTFDRIEKIIQESRKAEHEHCKIYLPMNETSNKVDNLETDNKKVGNLGTENSGATNEESSTQENNIEGLEMGVYEETDDEMEDSIEEGDKYTQSNYTKGQEEQKAQEYEPLLSNPLKRKLNMNTEDNDTILPTKKRALSSDFTTESNSLPYSLQNGTNDDCVIINSDQNHVISSKSLLADQRSIQIFPKNTKSLVKNRKSTEVPNNDNVLDIDPSASSKSIESGKCLTRKVFLCAACHVYFEYWNLYLHMLEFHKRFICLYCLGMFGNSSNLCEHLLKHHNICTKHIAAGNSLGYKEYTDEKYILTCTTCGAIVQNNDLVNHTCSFTPDKDPQVLLKIAPGRNRSKNSSLNSSSESYPDPESFMLATMTEGDDKSNKDGDPEIITLEGTPEKVGSRLVDNLIETINAVAENRSHQSQPEPETIPTTPGRSSPPIFENTKAPSIGESTEVPPSDESTLSACSEVNNTPAKIIPSDETSNLNVGACAALSELEKCHKLVIEERSSGDDTESDLEDSLPNKSLEKCASEMQEESLDQTKETEKPPESDRKESSTTNEDRSNAQKSYLDKLFDAKVMLDVLEISPKKFSSDKTEKSSLCDEEKSLDTESVNEVSKSSESVNDVSKSIESVNDVSKSIEFDDDVSKSTEAVNDVSKSTTFDNKTEEDVLKDTPEKEMLNVSDDIENDDDNREDFNDSDNENSLKIDDSAFEDDDEPMDTTQEVVGSKPAEETCEEKLTEPAIKINPLRIKIKCGAGNTGDTYERIKTETEIKEKEARERRYDEAIDEAIRKSVMYIEEREASEAQKEKDEYERLQKELAKKQEEYQRIQEQYQNLYANESKEADQEHTGENESTEHYESLEETSTDNKAEHTEIEEREENHEVDRKETETEDRVKLIERSNNEKASLLKEELLKKCEKLFAGVDQLPEEEQEMEPAIELASEDIQPMALSLDDRLESLDIRVVIKECVRTSCSICVYCYHATRIVVNGKQLALHILAEHRYTPVKNDTSDDLIHFIKTNISQLENEFFSSDTFDPTDKTCFHPFDNIHHCLQCSFASKHQRELTSHKRKMHPKTSQICLLCKQILLNQSELLFHYCAGVSNPNPQDNIYWCGICGLDKIPSAFRLMVHLRKKHNTCNVCLEPCANDSKLLQHMLKHKIIHMCYKCNISYRNKQDITKHLFWKHGTESIVCKKCLQKRWSHVYHFCQPPARFTCDECNMMFKKSISLDVHKRIHRGIYPYECKEEGCQEKFISRKLLEKHAQWHQEPPKPPTPPPQDSKNESHSLEPHIDVCNVDDAPNPAQDLKQSSKSKKKKKSKFDLNSMNLPSLNLSESDSSDEDVPSVSPSTQTSAEEPKADEPTTSDAKVNNEVADQADILTPPDSEPPSTKNVDTPQEIDKLESNGMASAQPGVDMPDLTADVSGHAPNASPSDEQGIVPPAEEPAKASIPPLDEPLPVADIVPDVWDQFKSFTQSLNVYRHVDEEHDYHVIYERPPVVEPEPEVAPEPNVDVGTEESEAKAGEVPEAETTPLDKSADTALNKTTSDDSSSDSSSSSSCGSQCGSNCSCSSSSSSSSSSSEDSSSDSDSSDPENRKRQEEKRATKKAEKKKKTKKHHNASDEVNVTIENSPPRHSPEPEVPSHHEVIPPPLPPPIHESDLDTEVSSSDEDFYDEKPQLAAPKVEEKPPVHHSLAAPPQSPLPPCSPPPHHYTLPQHPPVTPVQTPSRTPKKRKRPRMRNVPTSTPKTAPAFKHPFMRPSPAFEMKKTPQPLISSFAETPPPPALSSDDHTRSSKRKRKQNRFYGYSDDEDSMDYDNDESEEFSIVKHPPLKKKLLWKRPSTSFNDKIPLPPASPPYENKIRIENPFRKSSTDYETSSPAHSYASPQPVASSSSSESEPEPEPYIAPPVTPYQPQPAPVPLYCYCRCPYDEVSEMIACDGDDCEIEWYHFECVNILVPPKGKWYCPQCRPKYQPF